MTAFNAFSIKKSKNINQKIAQLQSQKNSYISAVIFDSVTEIDDIRKTKSTFYFTEKHPLHDSHA